MATMIKSSNLVDFHMKHLSRLLTDLGMLHSQSADERRRLHLAACHDNDDSLDVLFELEMLTDGVAGHVTTYVGKSRAHPLTTVQVDHLNGLALLARPDLVKWLEANTESYPLITTLFERNDYLRLLLLTTGTKESAELYTPKAVI